MRIMSIKGNYLKRSLTGLNTVFLILDLLPYQG